MVNACVISYLQSRSTLSAVQVQLSCAPLVPKQALCAVAGAGCDSATAGTTTTEVAKNPGPRIVYPAVSSLPRIYRSVANPPSSSFPHQPRAPPMGTHLAQTAVKTCICRLCLIQNRQHLQCMLLDPSIYKTFLICNIQDACILWVFCQCCLLHLCVMHSTSLHSNASLVFPILRHIA